MEVHAYAPEVGINDITSDEQNVDYKNVYVHIPKDDIISENYSYQNLSLWNITHQYFESYHALDAHSIDNFVTTSIFNDDWDKQQQQTNETYTD